MKTSILITGQPMSKQALSGACQLGDFEVHQHNVGISLYFNTKREAIKALSYGYQYLKSDKEDWKKSNGSYKYGSVLSYDAGRAIINEH